MDPLSEVLALIKPESLISGGYLVDGEISICFGKHPGIKCYAMITGQCWVSVDGVPGPVLLTAGDCYLLPRGLAFTVTADLSLTPVDFRDVRAQGKFLKRPPPEDGSGCYLAGGHFALNGGSARMLLDALPPIVHIQREADRAAMRWSLERLKNSASRSQVAL